ncbi:MAG: glutamate-5-semialdehyde dehydrogenase [Deltaproteobacteria bacterium]|nr:glutamate-5-semialdehyde dehydrogenase [Candidatus Anaeroferrophillus wilburensis]MBN2889237.1 glutamate-5-semialdehyde dehydrogenase [Deltaproteobacteria bacterium]
MSMVQEITAMARQVKDASRVLATMGTTEKDHALRLMAAGLRERRAFLQEQNRLDLTAARQQGLSPAMIDRLTLSDGVIEAMAVGLEEVAAFADPVGEVTRMWKRPNGLLVGKMRIPLGVIGMIYESRPNVTADAAGLCLKAGNGVILRGGSEAIHSNLAILKVLHDALAATSIPREVIQVIPLTDRQAITEMLKLEDCIDLVIPRGGEGLIRFVVEHSRIPVIKHYKGVCHVFVDQDADLVMAREIVINAKTHRPGVCNALETLLVHRDIAPAFLPLIVDALRRAHVEVRGCEQARVLVPDLVAATEEDWHAEYLSLILAVRVVDDLDRAVEHINRYGSDHTETIVTSSYERSQEFLQRVNSSVVMVNASTRFSDGGQMGLGAEIGISTTKLHAYGPMGLEGLTTTKYIIYGNGQIRQ